MMTIGFLVGVVFAAPVFFAIGLFAGIDRMRSHERADITPALRRSVR